MKRHVANEKGMATLEMLPLLFVFIYLFAYTLGAFGVIHTAIKYSISARTYAFETFRNRTNLVYFRDKPGSDPVQYKTNGNRFHGIIAANTTTDQGFRVTERPIRMAIAIQPSPTSSDPKVHTERVPAADELQKGKRNQTVEVSPVWVMIAYGICIDANCGG